jgi:signal transduction histidine kinase
VDITVTDSGAGIPAAIREKMFQPFFTSKEPGKGTGLGLSIARGIVGQHRGTLTVAEGSPHTRMIMRVPQAQPAGAAGLC